MKKLLSMFLAFTLIFSLIPTTALAATDDLIYQADVLNSLGLFAGTGTDSFGNPNYELEKTPTRQEAITLLVGLIGKTNEAKNKTWNTPFTDVPSWSKPFVGYAYANKITSGTSATTFGCKNPITATQYITFVLGALGYESGKDFQWNRAWILSDQLGITTGQFNENTKKFTRSDIVSISYNALAANLKNSNVTLLEQLKSNNAVPENASLDLPSVVLNDSFPYDKDSSDVIYKITATIIGDRYKFDAEIKPDTFYVAYFFPAELDFGDSVQGFTFFVGKSSNTNFSFSIPADYIFNNSCNTERMVIDFAEDDADGGRVGIAFETATLPK